MSDAIALPTALGALQRRLQGPSSPDDLLQVLRALQRLGLKREELVAYIERIRAVNEATVDDDDIEENCVFALEVVYGTNAIFQLRWDLTEVARVHLPLALSTSDLADALEHAFTANDLLPARREFEIDARRRSGLTTVVNERLQSHAISLEQADFYRVPKAGFTTRPAAVLAMDDRVAYEALANKITDAVDLILPIRVVWPRGRGGLEDDYGRYVESPMGWDSRYVVVADIESFYECISHSLLILFLESNFAVSRSYLHALEGLLYSIMGTDVGLPQGPNGSEIFASAFLATIDRQVESKDWRFVRYADDYLIGADSIADGRRKITDLESHLREIGLRLSPAKTKLMRMSTYLEGLENPSKRLQESRKSIEQAQVSIRDAMGIANIESILEQAGVSQDDLHSLLYRHHETLDGTIEAIRDALTPELIEGFGRYFEILTDALRSSPTREDMASLERDIAECLTFASAARRRLDIDRLQNLLLWFPRLTEQVAAYLSSISREIPDVVRGFLSVWLNVPADLDWTTAWVCSVATKDPTVINEELHAVFLNIVRDSNYGGLTRSEIVRALAQSRRLNEATWNEVLSSISIALRSELIFTALAEPDIYRFRLPEIGSV